MEYTRNYTTTDKSSHANNHPFNHKISTRSHSNKKGTYPVDIDGLGIALTIKYTSGRFRLDDHHHKHQYRECHGYATERVRSIM
jgi:hypothetical protein